MEVMKAKDFKQTRKDLGLTQRQLAKELGLSEKNGDVYIRRVENGGCEPSGLLIRCFEFFIKLQPRISEIDEIEKRSLGQLKAYAKREGE